MKRILPLLVPWMVLAGAANAVQIRTADVLYTYRDAIPQRGSRVGDECFVPIEQLAQFGWTTDVTGDKVSIQGESQGITTQSRVINGQPSVAIRHTIELLGGRSQWRTGTDTLDIYDVLRQVSVHAGKVLVSGKLSFKPYAFLLTNPNRAVIDLVGVRLGNSSETRLSVDSSVRVSQYKNNTVRIVTETGAVPLIPRDVISATSELSLDLNPPIPEGERTIQRSVPPPVPVGAPLTFNLKVDIEGKESTLLLADLGPTFNGSAQYAKLDPSTVQVILKNYRAEWPEGFKLNSEAISRTDVSIQGSDTRLILSLRRPMGAEVGIQGGQLSIQLLKPDVGDGKLAGKVVVVDAGHGGQDSGAHEGDIREKDLTLSIAKLVSADLARGGAMVIMTRKTDVFIPLLTRSEIANRNQADFFISCHINANQGNTSGGITFHHKGNAISRLLAECIQAQIAKVSAIKNLGVWSDGRIHPSGFSVLRNTKMPGVLIEFGFIDNSKDRRRMITDDFQRNVANAVVRGVRSYLGDPTFLGVKPKLAESNESSVAADGQNKLETDEGTHGKSEN